MKKTKIKSKKEIVSLEIGDNYIKLSEARLLERKYIFRLASRKLSSKEDSVISQEITNLIHTLNISKKRILLNIPRHLVIARFLRLPSTKDNEIKDMVRIESAKQIPYATEEIMSGYRILEKTKDGYSNILLSIAQASVINRFINVLKNANLEIEKIALGSESLFNWYILTSNSVRDRSNIALINIDSNYVDIDIIENGEISFTRAFSYDESNKNTIIDELKKSITTYQKQKNLRVDKIIISGAINKVKELESILKIEIDLPLEVIDQTRNIELDKTIDTDLNEISFIELIGLSLKSENIKIDLLPESIKEENEFYNIKRNLVKTLILIVGIILIFSGLMIKKLSDKSSILSFLNSEIKTMEPKVKKAQRMKEDIRIIKEEIQKKPLAIDILSEIYKITIKDITFNLLDYESNQNLILRGNAPSLDDVIKFISILENSQYFENVQMRYTTKRSIIGKEVTDFEIVCMLSRLR